MKSKYTKEILQEAVKKSLAMTDVLDILRLKRSGGNHYHISNLVKKYGIDKSHFLGKSYNRNKEPINKHTKESFLEKVLCENGKGWRSSEIKRKIIDFGIKEDVCEICGQKPYWNNKKLSLQLDHIDGNHLNNKLSNLRVLCPNCHTQTDTFSIRKPE